MNVKNITLVLLTIILFPVSRGQAQITSPFHEDTVHIVRDSGQIYGSLITLQQEEKLPIALIISGSGPTDRNGNNPVMTNNSLKMLADSLAAAGIGSIRYDKRGVAASMAAPEAELTVINGMNHIFKPSSLDRQENIATYRDPDLPIMQELVKSITKFIIEEE